MKTDIEPHSRTLELDDKPHLHRLGWVWQSVLWSVFGLCMLAGALGLFGGGWLGKRTLGEEISGFWIEYDWLARQQATALIQLHWVAPDSGISVVQFPAAYLKEFKMEAITPTPASVVIHNGQIKYTFAGKGAITTSLSLTPETVGTIQGSVQVNGKTYLLNHFVYP